MFYRLFPIILQGGISTAAQEEFQGVESRNIEKRKIDTNANKIKQHIPTLWKNTLLQGSFNFKEASLFSIL